MLYNKLYKKISVVALGTSLMALPLFTGCNSEVVELSPVRNFSDQTAYGTAARCELSMIGAYDAAQCGMYINSGNGWQRGYPFGAASIEQGEMRGEDMNLTAQFYDYTYSATFNLSTANNVAMWETSFEAINRYNTVMEGEEIAKQNGVIDEAMANQYKGECLFLRALTYHNLMIHYALPINVNANNNYGLPLYLTAINSQEAIEAALAIGRSSVQETYAQIIKDLDEAEALLPDVVAAGNKISRASKGAAIGLKTRVYLHMRDWAKVVEEAKKLEGGRFALENDPATPFTASSNNAESMFSIENSTDDNPDVNGALGQMLSARPGGRSMITSSPIVYNSKFWTKDDKRRNLLLYRESDKYYFCDKYQDPTTQDAWAPILRYAEVLLNEAEAAARVGNKELALEKLNQVRNRSLANPATEAYKATAFADTKALVEAILWERRIEMNGEGRRWEDIHRLAADDLCPSGGIPAKIEYNNAKGQGAFVVGGEVKAEWYSANKKAIPYTDKRFLWPIPLNDILRNPTLAAQQNAGW